MKVSFSGHCDQIEARIIANWGSTEKDVYLGMSTAYKFNNPEGIYFMSIATVEWVDVFSRKDYVELSSKA